MERPRNYADPAKTTYIPAGPLTFGIEYRHLQTDQGICIHVFGDLNGSQEEFLRFDCFERAPHYHYAWSTDDQYVALDTTAEGDPLHWTLDRLRTRLPAMLIRAGAGELARTLDQRDIDAALPTIRGWAESLQTQERQERSYSSIFSGVTSKATRCIIPCAVTARPVRRISSSYPVWREILDMPSGAWGNQKKARPSKTLNRYKLSDMLFNSDTPDN